MTAPPADWQRLDHWLWCARFFKTRSECARLAEAGSIRINRQPTDKAHARLRVGDVLTLPLARDVIVIRLLALATRRGPAPEARALYEAVAAHNACTNLQTSAYAAPECAGPLRSS